MASLSPDKGVLSHGEELERNNMNAALKMATALETVNPEKCVWKSYDTCRNCGLYANCFTEEAQHGAA